MKKRNIRGLLLAVLCLMICLLAAVPAAADEEEDWVEIGYAQVTTNTALRTKANTKTCDSLIKIVKKNAVVKVLKKSGVWYQVTYGTKTGWILGIYLTNEDDDNTDDNVVVRRMAIDTVFRSSAKVTTENELDVIRAGEEVEILGERSDNWVQVIFEDEVGYIPNGYFTSDAKTGSGYAWKYAAQPMYIRSSTKVSNSNVVGTLKKGKKIKIIGVSGNWYKVKYKGATRYIKSGYFTNETKTAYVSETIATKINFRKSRSTKEDNIIRVLSPGTVVRVYKATSKIWYKIKAGSTTGYILGGYFVSDMEESSGGGSSSVTRITTAALNMRSGKGTSSPKIITIPKGEIVTLKIKSGDWYKVTYMDENDDKYEGWVYGDYLEEDYV